MMAPGTRVVLGDTPEDHDHGRVVRHSKGWILIAWDSGVTSEMRYGRYVRRETARTRPDQCKTCAALAALAEATA